MQYRQGVYMLKKSAAHLEGFSHAAKITEFSFLREIGYLEKGVTYEGFLWYCTDDITRARPRNDKQKNKYLCFDHAFIIMLKGSKAASASTIILTVCAVRIFCPRTLMNSESYAWAILPPLGCLNFTRTLGRGNSNCFWPPSIQIIAFM